jgi:hypothetical protein
VHHQKVLKINERIRASPYCPALVHRVFRRVLPGAAASALGDGMSAVAIAWLALKLAPPGNGPGPGRPGPAPLLNWNDKGYRGLYRAGSRSTFYANQDRHVISHDEKTISAVRRPECALFKITGAGVAG